MIAPIIEDDLPPYKHDSFSEEDLLNQSLLSLYHRSCTFSDVRPNRDVEIQLPKTIQYKPFLKVIILDLSKSYLGPLGASALVPVIESCRRLTHLYLQRTGFHFRAALPLIGVITRHPSLKEVNMSHNHLGTRCGKELLKAVTINRRLLIFVLDGTLIIPMIKKKIDAQLARNGSLAALFDEEHPFEDDELLALKRVKKKEEEECAERQAEAIREIGDVIPSWMPIALSEICSILYSYRCRMPDLFSVFRFSCLPSTGEALITLPVDSNAALSLNSIQGKSIEVSNRLCSHLSLREFHRGMQVLGISSLRSSDHCLLFCDAMGVSWIESLKGGESSEDVKDNTFVNLAALFHGLRVHTSIQIELEDEDRALYQLCADSLFDTEDALLDCCALIDVDQTRTITVQELISGIASLLYVPLLWCEQRLGKSAKRIKQRLDRAGQEHYSSIRADIGESPTSFSEPSFDDDKALITFISEWFVQLITKPFAGNNYGPFFAFPYDILVFNDSNGQKEGSGLVCISSYDSAVYQERCRPEYWATWGRSALRELAL